MRHSSLGDFWLEQFDTGLRTLWGQPQAQRPSPAASAPNTEPLTPAEKQLSIALMRVNHVGEVCAQALYQAQALSTQNPLLKNQFKQAAREEEDHLAWTQQRLEALGARGSLLNPLWFAGAFALGLIAGKAGDPISLGFLVETERQVESHLERHLLRLPANDLASRAIVEQMKIDEAAHGKQAEHAGAKTLPAPIKALMKAASRIMTTTAHWI